MCVPIPISARFAARQAHHPPQPHRSCLDLRSFVGRFACMQTKPRSSPSKPNLYTANGATEKSLALCDDRPIGYSPGDCERACERLLADRETRYRSYRYLLSIRDLGFCIRASHYASNNRYLPQNVPHIL